MTEGSRRHDVARIGVAKEKGRIAAFAWLDTEIQHGEILSKVT